MYWVQFIQYTYACSITFTSAIPTITPCGGCLKASNAIMSTSEPAGYANRRQLETHFLALTTRHLTGEITEWYRGHNGPFSLFVFRQEDAVAKCGYQKTTTSYPWDLHHAKDVTLTLQGNELRFMKDIHVCQVVSCNKGDLPPRAPSFRAHASRFFELCLNTPTVTVIGGSLSIFNTFMLIVIYLVHSIH